MEKSIITFSANEQNLQKTGGIGCYASDTVSYIEAHFALGENWNGYDSIRAVWFNDYKTISTVLDSDGVCIVPHEVLVNRGKVMVNLVGSVLVSDELSDRLTTFPCEALKVSAKAKISGSETAAVTPSQFEQFVSIVISEVEKVTGMTAQAETLPAGSQATARYENGILYLGIPQGIQGERGETGADGADGNGIASVVYNADYTLTLIFDNGERFTTPPIRGERGPAGADGRDGTDGADGVTPNLSIGNVETLEPSEDAYVTRRGTDDNPIFDFGIPKGDTGTVPDLDLILPTDTASGDIASITDGQSVVPVKSLKVTLEPIQDLHGYDKPWSGGAGKNKLPMTLNGIKSANTGTWVGNAYTSNGITFTILVDEVDDVIGINVAGTATSNAYLYVATGLSVTSGQKLNGAPSSGRLFISNLTGTTDYAADVGSGGTVNADATDCRSYIQILNGTTVNNAIYKPMLRESTETDATFAPYTNICPISGHTEVVTTISPTTDAEDGTSYTTTLGRTVYGGTLDVVSGELVVDRAMVDLSTLTWLTTSTQTADGSQCHYADVSGMATDTANTGMISDRFSLASGKYISTMVEGTMIRGGGKIYVATDADTISGQLCYPLATPQTYQLDPQTISLLHGNNNVWSDGEVELTYNADVGLYIDKKLGTSGTSTLSMTRTLAKSEDTDNTKSDNIQLAED